MEKKRKSLAEIEYYQGQYPDDHWAVKIPTLGDKNYVATLKIYDVIMTLKLNTSDSRGYRGIVCLAADDIRSTFNRSYTSKEKYALSTALNIFSMAYENFGMISQVYVAGNNSQSVTPEGRLLLGNEKEPSMLHGHIVGRGNPILPYIYITSLKGPKPGLEMNLRGDGKEEGNNSKVKWNDEELEVVSKIFGEEVYEIVSKDVLFSHVEILSHNQR